MVKNHQPYREKVSQMISWGHWFTLVNILFSLILGSRYLFVADWPSVLPGRIYAIISLLGHFSFLVFALYLLIIFPLTFVVMSQRLLRFIFVVLATSCLTLLLLDSEIFANFRLHLNPIVWQLVTNPEQSELSRDWQVIFICVPVIFLVEMLFATWSWQKLRSLNRQRFAKPIAVVFIVSFIATHLIYIWADANFYRPITMQRTNLPLSYPMTARKFLEKHGLLDAQEFEQRLMQQGNPDAAAVQYPLSSLSYKDKGSGYNLLLIVLDDLRQQDIDQGMPELHQFAQENSYFNHHYSSGYSNETGLFGLFYGISATYLDGIVSAHKPSALITALNAQGYQFGLFSSKGFNNDLYRKALLSDFTLPPVQTQSNTDTTQQWQRWLTTQNGLLPWFSYISYHHDSSYSSKQNAGLQNIDTQIAQVLETLKSHQLLDNTVVVITAEHGIELNKNNQDKKDFSQEQLQVPLIIRWPGTSPQVITKMTSHMDLMRTLMQRLLHVKTAPSNYSQGEDLFLAQRQNNWLVTGDNNQLVIITPTQILMLDKNGHYHAYDKQHNEIPGDKPQLTLLLQALTDINRFIAN